MEFTLLASATPNNELLKKYPCLYAFGYFIGGKSIPRYEPMRNENGAPMWQYLGARNVKTPKVIINDLDDLISLMRMTEQPVILNIDKIEDPNCTDFSVELYDGYRE